MEPKTSVIIITYNQKQHIVAAFESILAQQYKYPYEIVVGDDCSTDGTREICERIALEHPGVVRLMPKAPNKGIAGNYFDCLAACRGEYVADCAGDDTWGDPARMQVQSDYLDSHPDDIAVLGDWDIVRSAGVVNSRTVDNLQCYRRHLEGKEMTRLALGSAAGFPLLSAMMFRRRPVARILDTRPDILRRDRWGCEDVPMVAALGSLGDFGFIPLTASRYYLNEETTSNSRQETRLFDFYIKTAECVLDLCRIHGVSQREIAGALEARLRFLGDLALRLGDSPRLAQYAALCRRMDSLPLLPRLYAMAAAHPSLRKIAVSLKKHLH